MNETLISKTIDAVEIHNSNELVIETNSQLRLNTNKILINFVPLSEYIKNIVFSDAISNTYNRTSANNENNSSALVDLTSAFETNSVYNVSNIYCSNIDSSGSKVNDSNHCITFSSSNSIRFVIHNNESNIVVNTNSIERSLSKCIYDIINTQTPSSEYTSFIPDTTLKLVDVSTFGTMHTNTINTNKISSSNVIDGIFDVSSDSAINFQLYGYDINSDIANNLYLSTSVTGPVTNLKDFIYSKLHEDDTIFTIDITPSSGANISFVLKKFQNNIYGNKFVYDLDFMIIEQNETVPPGPNVFTSNLVIESVISSSAHLPDPTTNTFYDLTAGLFYKIYCSITNKHTNTVTMYKVIETNIPTIRVRDVYTLDIDTPRTVTVDSETVNGLTLKHTWTVSSTPVPETDTLIDYTQDNNAYQFIIINNSADQQIYVWCVIEYMSGGTVVFTIPSTIPVKFLSTGSNYFNNNFNLTSGLFNFTSTTSYTSSFTSSNTKIGERVKDPSGNVVPTYTTPGTYTLEVHLQNQFGFTKWVTVGTANALVQATAPVVHSTTSPSPTPFTIVNYDSIELYWTPNANGDVREVTYSISIDNGTTYIINGLPSSTSSSTSSYTLTSSDGITPSLTYNIVVKKVVVSPIGIGLNDQSSSALPVTTDDVILKPIIDITQTIRQHVYIILHWLNNDSSDYTSNVRYDIYSPDNTLLVEDAVSPYTVEGLTHDTSYNFVVRKVVTSGAYTGIYANSDVENISTRRDYRALEEFLEVHGTTDSFDLRGSGLTYDLRYKYFFTQDVPSFRRFELWYGSSEDPPHPSGYYSTDEIEDALEESGYVKYYTTYTWVRSETVTGIPQPNEYYAPRFFLRTILFENGQEFEYVWTTIRIQKFVMLERLSANSFSVRQSFVSSYITSYLVEKSDGSIVEYTTSGSNTFTVTGIPPGYTPGVGLNEPLTVTFSHEIFGGDRIIIKLTVDSVVYPSDPYSLNWTATWLSNYIEASAMTSLSINNVVWVSSGNRTIQVNLNVANSTSYIITVALIDDGTVVSDISLANPTFVQFQFEENVTPGIKTIYLQIRDENNLYFDTTYDYILFIYFEMDSRSLRTFDENNLTMSFSEPSSTNSTFTYQWEAYDLSDYPYPAFGLNWFEAESFAFTSTVNLAPIDKSIKIRFLLVEENEFGFRQEKYYDDIIYYPVLELIQVDYPVSSYGGYNAIVKCNEGGGILRFKTTLGPSMYFYFPNTFLKLHYNKIEPENINDPNDYDYLVDYQPSQRNQQEAWFHMTLAQGVTYYFLLEIKTADIFVDPNNIGNPGNNIYVNDSLTVPFIEYPTWPFLLDYTSETRTTNLTSVNLTISNNQFNGGVTNPSTEMRYFVVYSTNRSALDGMLYIYPNRSTFEAYEDDLRGGSADRSLYVINEEISIDTTVKIEGLMPLTDYWFRVYKAIIISNHEMYGAPIIYYRATLGDIFHYINITATFYDNSYDPETYTCNLIGGRDDVHVTVAWFSENNEETDHRNILGFILPDEQLSSRADGEVVHIQRNPVFENSTSEYSIYSIYICLVTQTFGGQTYLKTTQVTARWN